MDKELDLVNIIKSLSEIRMSPKQGEVGTANVINLDSDGCQEATHKSGEGETDQLRREDVATVVDDTVQSRREELDWKGIEYKKWRSREAQEEVVINDRGRDVNKTSLDEPQKRGPILNR